MRMGCVNRLKCPCQVRIDFTNGNHTSHLPDTDFIVNARLSLDIIQARNYWQVAEEANALAIRACSNSAYTAFFLGFDTVRDRTDKTGRVASFDNPGTAAHFVDLVHNIRRKELGWIQGVFVTKFFCGIILTSGSILKLPVKPLEKETRNK